MATSRRRLLAGAVAAGATAAGVAGSRAAAGPNIVVVVLDDMRDSDWEALPETRAWIARDGTFFPNFFLTTPLCSPSRTSLLTGLYAHNHGVVQNDGKMGGYAQFQQRKLAGRTIAVAARQAGYRTALVGKYLNGFEDHGHVPPGWDLWAATSELAYRGFSLNVNGHARQYAEHGHYVTDVLEQFALDFVGGPHAADGPFLLWLTERAPHGPATPARVDRGAFPDATAKKNDAFDEADIGDKPAFVRRRRALGPKAVRHADGYERKRLESLLPVDRTISKLRETLAVAGRLESTTLFVLSDNGLQMGEHRLPIDRKETAYDGSARVTMGAVGPGFGGGRVDARLCGNLDLTPTVAELIGVGLPGIDGRSLLGGWERDALLLEGFGEKSPRFSALRSRSRLYVEYGRGGERELYDLDRDPDQLENLLADWDGRVPTAAATAEAAQLGPWLRRLEACAGDACREADQAAG